MWGTVYAGGGGRVRGELDVGGGHGGGERKESPRGVVSRVGGGKSQAKV